MYLFKNIFRLSAFFLSFGWAFGALAQPGPEPVVGTIPGAFSVTLSGSSSYTIPILVAPGAADTQPKLQLTYSSQSLSGVLGAGWSITGISVITRGPKDQFTDGLVAGIRLDDDDALFLDGQRLIAIGQRTEAGKQIIEYRKAFDDQTRIVRTGIAFGSSTFVVDTKGGLRLLFDGSNANAKVDVADGTILALAASYISDTVGNFIEFKYVSNGRGDHNVKSIKYTGLGSWDQNGVLTIERAPFATVTFDYDATSRPLSSFIAGREIVRESRLKRIRSTVEIPGEAQREASRYEFDFLERSNGDRFVLAAVHQFGDDGTKITPTTFNYSDSQIEWHPAEYTFPNAAVLASREKLGAAYRLLKVVPGSVRPDLMFAAQIDGRLVSFTFQNNGALAPQFWTANAAFNSPVPFVTADGADLGVIAESISGSSGGRVDLLQSYSANNQTTKASFIAGASKFESDSRYELPFLVAKDGARVASYKLARWSGGPGPDMLFESEGRRGFLKNTTSGWQEDPRYAAPIPVDSRARILDFDCSGKIGLLGAVTGENGNLEWRVYRFGGAQWELEPNDRFKPQFPADTDPEAIREVKFGTTRCTGLIVASAVGVGIRGAYVASGTGWQELAAMTPPFDLVDSKGRPSKALAADFIGDGRSHVIANTQLNATEFASFSYQQTSTGWTRLDLDATKKWIPPVLATLVPNAQPISVLVGNLDGAYGDDLVLPSDARRLPGDNQERFGQIFTSGADGFETKAQYSPPTQFARRDKQDRGVRILDLHGGGLPDVIVSRNVTRDGAVKTESAAFRNTGRGWEDVSSLAPQVAFSGDDLTGNPVQFADVTGGGFADMIYSYRDKKNDVQCHLFKNAEDGAYHRKWIDAAATPELVSLIPPICPQQNGAGAYYPLSQHGIGDLGVRFLKLDKHRLAMLVAFQPPRAMDANGKPLPIQKCETDQNGAPINCVLDTSNFRSAAFVLDGDRWVEAPDFAPPIPFVAQIDNASSPSVDLFVQTLDMNGDSLPDLVARFKHPHDQNLEVNQVWINSGNKWELDRSIVVPYPLDAARWEEKALTQLFDVNADGLPDLVFTKGPSTAQTWLGNGKGWAAAPQPAWSIPSVAIADTDGDPGYRLVDMDGDGLVDVYYSRTRIDGIVEKGLFLNNGATWTNWAGSLPERPFFDKDGIDLGVRLMSVTGKGVTDIIQSFEGVVPTVDLNVARRANILESIVDGYGLKTRIWYQTLLEIDGSDPRYAMPANLLSDRVYERGVPATFPIVAPVPNTYVVRRVSVEESGRRSASLSYRYGEYRVDNSAMRSLGFGWRESINEVNNVLTRTVLVQDPRLRNSVRRESTCELKIGQLPAERQSWRPLDLCPSGGGRPAPWTAKLTELTNCWTVWEGDVPPGRARKLEDCWDSSISPAQYNSAPGSYVVRQISLAKTRVVSFELDGSVVSDTLNGFEFDEPANLLHRHANVLKSRSELTDGTFVETVNEYSDDETRWFLGRLTQTSVTKAGDFVAAGHAARSMETKAVQFTYDETNGLLKTQILNPGGKQTIISTYERDKSGNIIATKTEAIGEKARTERIWFDSLHRFVVESENAMGQRSARINSPTTGKPLIGIDSNGLKTTVQYDGFGRTTKQINPDGVTATTRVMSLTELSNLESGLDLIRNQPVAFGIVSQVDQLPPSISLFDRKERNVRTIGDGFTKDARFHRYVLRDTEYDVLGRVTKMSLPYELGKSPNWTVNEEYDLFNRVRKTRSPDGLLTHTIYEGGGPLGEGGGRDGRFKNCKNSRSEGSTGGATTTVIIDPTGKNRRTIARINMRKQLTYSVDSGGGCVTNDYDASGRTTRLEAPGGAVTLHTYDPLGRRIKTSDPDLGVWKYEYDSFDRIVQQTDAKGQIATIEYDLLGRPKRRTLNDVTTDWRYDVAPNGVGKIAEIENSNGYGESFYYDRLGRPERRALRIGTEQFVSSTRYDRLGRPDILSYPTGFSVANIFDAKGFLVSVQDGANGKPFWTALEIDPSGRVTRELLGNGISTTREIDERNGQTKHIKSATKRSEAILDLDLEYDLIGNLEKRTEAVERKRERFTYDSLDRLVGMSNRNGVTSKFTFDDAGRLLFKSGVGRFHYAKPGDAHEISNDAEHSRPIHAVLSVTANDQREQYKYDLNGNLVSSPLGYFEYTSDNKVKLVFANDKKWTRFDYNASGERFRQVSTVGKLSTETIYAGPYERITEYGLTRLSDPGKYVRHRHYISNGSSIVAVFEKDAQYLPDAIHKWAASKFVGEIRHQETWYLHSDQLGSIVRITNAVGKIREKIWYDPWGKRVVKELNKDDEGDDLERTWTRGFTGHEHMDAFSMVHMNGRMYNPRLSAFTSVDPINQISGDTQSANGYMYARGNPLKYIDPTGNGLFEDIGDFFSGIGNAIGNGIRQIGRGIGDAVSGAGKWLSENWRTVVIVAAVIVVTVLTAGTGTPAVITLETAIMSGMAAGATAGALSAALYGGSVDDIIFGAIKGAVIGGISSAAFYGVGTYFSAQPATASSTVESIAAHGVVGGAREAAEGGNFWRGFIAGAVTKASSYGPEFTGTAANTAKAAVVGGTVAELSGGKFANGAITGAFSYVFNDAAHKYQKEARDGVVKALSIINPGQDQGDNIVPLDGNNARVIDPSKIDTKDWKKSISLHAEARSKVVPGHEHLEVKIYFNDSERGGRTTIGLVHSGFFKHTHDYFFKYDKTDRNNHTNADIAREFCSKVQGGCP